VAKFHGDRPRSARELRDLVADRSNKLTDYIVTAKQLLYLLFLQLYAEIGKHQNPQAKITNTQCFLVIYNDYATGG